ncbi:hypothetical protein H9Q13_10450 [Pontibacter sp. JH31]|uniref:Uncharacterized protein n=1 Tax=Pontibacter aquaedesilientis TaxID=2766980 RepID=A0ABR7XH20_9BACT|nr:hypothetical protein [Pontibacter aquaedesilientis]MBD1397587.1 hypothetical protein [Pontibacter aquaedesilientis]
MKKMIQKIINSRRFFILTGVMVIAVSSYFLFKSGYHVLFYNQTWGLDKNTFSYPRPFLEVVTDFAFWLLLFMGGIGIITGKKKGLLLGLLATGAALIPSLAYVLVAAGKVRTYSRSIMVNSTEREMTNLEKWNYIYADLFFSICLTLMVIATIVIIVKRRKYLEVTKQNTIPQQSL